MLLSLQHAPALADDSSRPLLFLGNKNLAPVVFIEDGRVSGLAIDLVHALESSIGRRIVVDGVDWVSAQDRVARGDADALIQINFTEERARIYDFSKPLLQSQFSIFTSSDRAGITGISSLRGLLVGVENGGLPYQRLKENSQIRLAIIPDFLQGFRMLKDGKLDAVVVDYRVGAYVLARNRLTNIKVSGEPIAYSESAIAVRKGNVELLAAINRGLDRIRNDGTYARIVSKWEPKEVVFLTREQITYRNQMIVIVILVGVCLLAIICALVLYRELRKRRRTEERWRLVFENSPVSLWEEDFSLVKELFDGLRQKGVVDLDDYFRHHPETVKRCAELARIVAINDSTRILHGAASKEELLGGLSDTFTPESFDTFREELVDLWAGRTRTVREGVVKTLAGERRNVTVHLTVCPGDEATLARVLVAVIDITPLKAQQDQLEHFAHYDVLTELPNRVLLADRLHQGMAQAQRRGTCLAVAYLDLDGFKEINDEHGHATGDQILIALANRMSRTLRDGDTLARIGGDEFIAVMFDLSGARDCVPTLDRLLAAVAQPIPLASRAHQVSASIGVTFYPQKDEVDADQLMRQADQAMYQAKLSGKNRYQIFDAEQDRSVRGHHESLEHVRHALTSREFVLYYQPKVNMRTGQVIGAEALIRWQHPVNGLLAPALFLPVIESHALAIDVGEWVIHSALNQIEAWQDIGLALPVSVNVSAYQLQQSDFVERMRRILAMHRNVGPGQLMLEVLETSALEDLAHVSQLIHECRAMGVSFALDDFGTGYSSLTYLKRLPVYKLKIDQSFVRDMLADPDDLAILQAVVGLATAFGRKVIAEGVETVEHGKILLQLGCELAQGYGIALPMPSAEIPAWVATWQPDPAWRNQRPVRGEDLSLLFASTEHRAWVGALEGYLGDESKGMPILDDGKCRFGRWLASEGRRRYGAHELFPAITMTHRQMHAAGANLCISRSAEDRRYDLGEIRRLCDELIRLETVLLRNAQLDRR